MALTATLYHWQIALSDVDRGVYESLDLRLARHPSESLRYLLTRTLAYSLCHTDGIRFSKGGLSSTEEPPVAVYDATGQMQWWIDVGAPSADRLHKAAKSAPRVSLFSHTDLLALRREARNRSIHRLEDLELWRIESRFLDELEVAIERDGRRNAQIELMRSEDHLYLTLSGTTYQGSISRDTLQPAD